MEDKLNLPAAPPEFLELRFCPSDEMMESGLNNIDSSCCSYPFAVSFPFQATVVSAQQLTHGKDVKKVIDICLNIQESNIEFQPGDTIGVIPKNPEEEVEEILKRLSLLEKADVLATISVKLGTLKKKASVPPHIPEKTTLRNLFKSCLDIRAVPKKIFLRVLSLHAKDAEEKKRMEELCSKEGSSEYLKNIVETRTSLLDLLSMFPSCFPPVERLLEHLPRLQARPYSIASSPLKNKQEFHIVFSLVELSSKKHEDKLRYGVCTGWLDSLTSSIHSDDPLLTQMNKLNLSNSVSNIKIRMYFRKSTGFTLPKDPTIPLILIGPGTGVAPFIGFLQHRALEKQKSDETTFGEIWLFFGCRYEDKDFLYRSELEEFKENGVLTHLFLSFSRSSNKEEPKYVQDNIRKHGKEFIKQVFEKNAVTYICGDAKNMGKDVLDTIAEEIQKEKGIGEKEAKQILCELQKEGRLLQDIWV